MKNKYHAIIFDLDGVICSTDRYHYLAWKRLADEEGIYFDETINTRLKGVSRMESLNIILERAERKYTEAEKRALCERKNKYYLKLLEGLNEGDLMQGALPTLVRMRELGVKTAVGSASKNARFILKKLGIEDCFDEVADGTMVLHNKPHPEVFVKACDLLNEYPGKCLVVEDAVAGVEAAYRGGFDCAGLGDAKKHKKLTYPIGELNDLFNIIRSA